MECLASSGSCSADGIQKAIDAHVIAPWVTATVSGSGSQITVGNNSAPSFKNKAVISSFQYGQSNGTGCTLDIIDEEGGAFDKFFASFRRTYFFAHVKMQYSASCIFSLKFILLIQCFKRIICIICRQLGTIGIVYIFFTSSLYDIWKPF